ncbi:ecotropic viral integration site 5 protein [Polyplosphaeria fusca]|uniref:Ecotropic viral integration site 5 protein n=1 Tax=Polyplosphaeria fusca TaxID=682080 RepID=A0A9P4QZI8_9PLEO|nr:ecotropic viral integration site 5 protein [Polyplosphaeria fusca]
MEAAKDHAMQPAAPSAAERSPRTHVDSSPLPTDSMVTVPLSEADSAQVDDDEDVESYDPPAIPQGEGTIEDKSISSRPSSAEIMQAFGQRSSEADSIKSPTTTELDSPTISLPEEDQPSTPTSTKRSRSGSNGSDHSAHVDWVELEKTEEQEPREQGQDEAMALLLSRLEQENNALAVDPKSGLKARARSQSRPPSLNQLRRLVQGQDASQVRFSLLPSPPPMTEIEFWAALVRDYPQTLQRLPTLTLNKIRGGVPTILRGQVWQSVSGARDKLIEDQYHTLCGESSPYENIINKDLGRSFPGVDMFKDPEGEGQKMLGRVLKCFSLYDHKIGYCQGLGFLVGPLLMQMGDKEAFCVLVRLMEDYDLRSSFLPDLRGLHLRIFQFQRLLHQHMPALATHLDSLEIESAYLSQWFLSFFAVTCPLPMLFRIYDVLFAEGASETIMRVALALMKRNEQKLLGLSEMEDVMQLLLGRQLWDPYGRNVNSADELVNDFVGFTNDVTRESLQKLEAQFRDSQNEGNSKQVQKSAISFLGRLWGPSNSSTKSVTLSPGLMAPSRPVSFLRRTPSKQSISGTTVASYDGTSDGSSGTQSTALTDVSRGSSGDGLSLKSGHESMALSIRTAHSAKDRDLHYQIEQLLMTVSQLQRSNSELEAELQKNKEDRREDHRIVRDAIDKMQSQQSSLAPSTKESRRRTTITAVEFTTPITVVADAAPVSDEAAEIASILDKQFPASQAHHRNSSIFETKDFLRESLARAKEQLSSETIRATAITRELADAQSDVQISRDALKETRHRLQDSYNQNQKLEKTIQDLRQSARKGSVPWMNPETPDTSPSLSRSNTADSAISATGGLRELRLGRTASQKKAAPPVFSKRSSSLATQTVLATENHAPVDNEALLLELVNAKTAEAVAKQELDEMKNKFESMKKAMGVQTPPVVTATTPAPTPPSSGGWGWGGWKRSASTTNANVTQ